MEALLVVREQTPLISAVHGLLIAVSFTPVVDLRLWALARSFGTERAPGVHRHEEFSWTGSDLCLVAGGLLTQMDNPGRGGLHRFFNASQARLLGWIKAG